jgi:hypothetical protein
VRPNMTTTFWDRTLFDFNDAINNDMFNQSPRVQLAEIGKPSAIGSQQAMGSGPVLPWIPDPVGKNWASAEAVLFCGSAYAGIFSPYSSRRGQRTMLLEEYAEAKPLEALQRVYFNKIIDPPEAKVSDAYYGKIQELCTQGADQSDLACVADASFIGLFDLCRASFVKRIQQNGAEKDICDTKEVIRKHCDVFDKYVRSASASEWLWRRVSEGRARRIVALGSVAEHGLLRLFQRHGRSIYIGGHGPMEFPKDVLESTDGKWVGSYAYKRLRHKGVAVEQITGPLKLDCWLCRSTWWTIREGGEERWRLLPIYHPTSGPMSGTTLAKTKALIRSM